MKRGTVEVVRVGFVSEGDYVARFLRSFCCKQTFFSWLRSRKKPENYMQPVWTSNSYVTKLHTSHPVGRFQHNFLEKHTK